MIMKIRIILCFLGLFGLFNFIVVGPELLAQEPANPPDRRFGIVESYVNSAEAMAAGAGYTRIILRWDIIQPAGRDDWKPANVPDPYIAAELAAGREVVAILIGTPDWASQGVNNPRAVPDMEAWGNFTKRVAQQYQGRIKHWIIWNKPDVWDTNNPGHTWLGSDEDYLRLLQSAYSNIKGVDSNMQVLLGGMTYHWDAKHDREQTLSRLLKLITADPEAPKYNYYFDAVPYHLYYNPVEMFGIVNNIRATLDQFGLGQKPIWVNEINAPPSDDSLEPPRGNPTFTVSSSEQAAFIIQAYALLIAAGADRIQVYKLRNSAEHPEDVEPFGLLRHDDTRRPAFAAYQVVTTHFANYTKATWLRQGDFYIVTLTRPQQTTTILWNMSAETQSFALNAIGTEALLVDEAGVEKTITAEEGVYTIPLPGATCTAGFCLMGGAPRVIVETGAAAERPSSIPLATATPTPTPLPSPTPTSSPTVTPTSLATATPTPLLATSTPVTTHLFSQTATPQRVAALSANDNTPDSAPTHGLNAPDRPTTTQIMHYFKVRTIFTSRRLLILVVIGAVLFTLIYYLEYQLWNRHYR